MLAMKTPRIVALPRSAIPTRTGETARMIFHALNGLTGLAAHDAELLARAAERARLMRSTGARWASEPEALRVALSELAEADAVVVEAAACYAADLVACDPRAWRSAAPGSERRALWLASILRVAGSLCEGSADAPDGVFATWTADMLYLELDGRVSPRRLALARSRVAGLEALAGRTVIIASATARRAGLVASSPALHEHLTGV